MSKERSEEEWEVIRSVIEKNESGEGFTTEFKLSINGKGRILIVEDLETHDKSLTIFPISDETSKD